MASPGSDTASGRLAGKRAVVVGAAGGIGSAAATAFAHEGAHVGLVDLPGKSLNLITEQLGDHGTTIPTDITDESAVQTAFATWRATHRSLDVLYVCSGVQLHDLDGPVHKVALDTWQTTHAVNAAGTFLVCKHAIPLMRDSGGGSVLICGSPTALTMSGAGYAAYASSKAAVIALARVIAADYARDHIRCNVIVPGPVRTGLIAALTSDEAVTAELARTTPLGRLAEPADLVGIAVFLASAESGYATGATFPVDGGVTVR